MKQNNTQITSILSQYFMPVVEPVEKVKIIKQVYKNNAIIRDRRLQTKFEGHYFSIFQELGFFDSLVIQHQLNRI